MLNAAAIAALIPHAGAMCLLEEIVAWDALHIVCRSGTHRRPDNPLRDRGCLHALSGIEYAAQAIAAHGALTAGRERPRAGLLISLRDVDCHARTLDGPPGVLAVNAERITGDLAGVLYGFRVRVGAVDVVAGRALVRLDADAGRAA